MDENSEILERMNQVSSMLNDLAVYLNRYPSDERARDWFCRYDGEREALLRLTDGEDR